MNKESAPNNNQRTPETRTLKSDLTELRKKLLSERLIGAGALIGTATLVLVVQNSLSNTEAQPPRDEPACEVPASEYGTLWATAEAASPQDAPADEVQKTLGDIAFNNGLTTTQQLSEIQELGLTAEQCSFVVEKDGTVTLLDE